MTFDSDGVVIVATKDSPNHAGDSAGLLGVLLGYRANSCRGQACQHLPRRVLAVADAGHQIIRSSHAIIGRNLLQFFVLDLFQRDAVFASFFFNQLAADFNGTLTLMQIQPVLDLVACARGLRHGQPVTTRLVAGLGKNFHDIAAVKLVAQRNHASVYLGANAAVTYFGVH